MDHLLHKELRFKHSQNFKLLSILSVHLDRTVRECHHTCLEKWLFIGRKLQNAKISASSEYEQLQWKNKVLRPNSCISSFYSKNLYSNFLAVFIN